MGTTHAAAVKAEASKIAGGLNRTVGVNGHASGRIGGGPDSDSWHERSPATASSGRQVDLRDLIVTKG